MAKKTPRGRASKSRPAKRAAVSKRAAKRRRAPARQLEQTGANDPLFVPHPRVLARQRLERSVAAEPYSALLETICGTTDDSQAVEQYDGTLGVTVGFVAAHQSAACQVQWNDNLSSIYTNPGDVSGVRWGSGTMITNDLFLTCGHLFDQTGGGWERPRVNGTSNIISPQEIARSMHL